MIPLLRAYFHSGVRDGPLESMGRCAASMSGTGRARACFSPAIGAAGDGCQQVASIRMRAEDDPVTLTYSHRSGEGA